MINKISNLKLVLGLVLLGLIYLAVVFLDSSKSDELTKELVSIDTSKVTMITIRGVDETVELYRESEGWELALATGKRISAVSSKVSDLLDDLNDISTDRLAAKDQSKWVDYGVDSSGVTVQVQEGEMKSLDLVIGQSGSTSYLRLAGEEEVYASDNFDGLEGKDDINNYRDNTFLQMKTDSIETISFQYPGDSAFVLTGNAGGWYIDGQTTDSIKTAEYIRKMNTRFSNEFSAQDGSSLGPAQASILISSKNQPPVSITAYQDQADSIIFHSTINKEAYFNDTGLGRDYFIGKSALMQDQ